MAWREAVVKRERPAPVLVLALGSLLLGGLGIIGAATAQVACWPLGGPGSPAAVVPLAPAAAQHLRDALPGFRAFEALLPGADLLLAALILGTGLVLFGGRGWSRRAALLVAAAVLLVQVVTMLYQFVVVLPGIEEWRERTSRSAPHPAPPEAGPPELRWVALLLLIGGLIFFVHAVATLAVLQAPTVAESFARGRPVEAPSGGE
jgi:hypothetical protein